MKKIFIMLLSLMMMGTGLSLESCSSDDEMENAINRIEPEHAVSDFFKSEWPEMVIGGGVPTIFFEDSQQDVCRVINSNQEFQAIYNGTRDLPSIDFQKYSLVMGRMISRGKIGEKSPTTLDSQRLMMVDGRYELDLYYNYAVPQVDLFENVYLCFWGIYPKLSATDVAVNLILR